MRSSRNLALGAVLVVVLVVSVYFLLPKSSDEDTIKHAMDVARQLSGYHYETQSVNTKVGDWSAPGKSRTNISAPKGTVTLIMIGTEPYIRVPVSDTFAHLVNAMPNNDPSSATGRSMLTSFGEMTRDIRDVLNLGPDKIGGVDVVHYKFSYYSPNTASDAYPGQEVWIQKSTGYVYQIRVMGSSEIVETYSRINEPVSPPIEAPAVFIDVSGDSVEFANMIANAFEP